MNGGKPVATALGTAAGQGEAGQQKVRGHWQPRLSRRQLLASAGGLAALGAAGAIGYEWPHGGTARNSPTPPVSNGRASGPSQVALSRPQVFVTRPDLSPPSVRVTSYGALSAPKFIFLSVRTYLGDAPAQQGLMVLDRLGRLVWFHPVRNQPFDFKVQAYRGGRALTWWQGDVVYTYGEGRCYIAGTDYQVMQEVQAGGGLQADLHEFVLSSTGTAFITAYETVVADLSHVGGQKRAKVVVGHAQEVDLASGKVTWDWDSLSHVPVEDSYEAVPKQGPYDYFHINSIAELPGGDLLISARNTWSVYRVERESGKVIWSLGGKRSSFTLGPGARFYWQHDARPHGSSELSIFDDGASPAEERQSRALVVRVDETARRASLQRAYLYPAGFLAANQGSVQLLEDGRVFVGWGNQPYFSEFSGPGELLLDGELPFGWHSYRAYTYDWDGAPESGPRAVALANPAGGSQVFVSWNGATSVDRWLVLAGKEPTSLEPSGSQPWSGFETSIAVNAAGPWFAVAGISASGREVGRSRPVRVGNAG